jgi:hypothetical protein
VARKQTAPRWQWHSVPTFGGGLHFSENPASIRDDEWTWGRGWLAQNGYAEIGPGYVQVTAGVWPGQGADVYTLVGLTQNAFDWDDQAVIAAFVDTTGPPRARLYKVNVGGVRTELTWDGAGFAASGDPLVRVHAAFLNGFMLFNFGIGGGPPTLIRWNGGATWHGIQTTGSPQAYYLASFGGHLVAGVYETLGIPLTPAGARGLALSSADDESLWLPAVSNTADFLVLDDVPSVVNALAPIGDNLGIFTRNGIYVLSPTGGDPPFTRHLYSRRGCLDTMALGSHAYASPLTGAMVGVTPIGTVYRGMDDFYVADLGQGIGRRVFAYYQAQLQGTDPPPFYLWHDGRGVLLIPTPTDLLCYEPKTSAWSQLPLPASPLQRHAVVWDTRGGGAIGLPSARHWIGVGNQLWTERSDGVPAGGEFVDSKDFHLGAPAVTKSWSRIKVEWEPLTNAATDAIEIFAAPHDAPSTALLGSPGLETQTLTFQSLGILTGGATELTCRLRSKYIRWRFKQKSGRARIRGFAFRHTGSGERAT